MILNLTRIRIQSILSARFDSMTKAENGVLNAGERFVSDIAIGKKIRMNETEKAEDLCAMAEGEDE